MTPQSQMQRNRLEKTMIHWCYSQKSQYTVSKRQQDSVILWTKLVCCIRLNVVLS